MSTVKSNGIIYNIQRYSIHDGPGIRTTIFFKGCPLRCFWCQNPESQSMKPEIFLNKDNCTLCGRCADACPTGASTLSERSATIDRSKCIGCGRCAEACPNEARTLVGRQTTVDEIMQEVIRDKKFYDNSGGGVTLSGGEPLAQPEFALSILQSCREAGIHTAIETCGLAAWPTMEKLLEYTDLVLYDIKCVESGKHRAAAGQPNELILENARKIARLKPMWVRVPMIPGFNDTIEEVKAITRFVRTELGPIDINLLAYNKLGEGKYGRLDRPAVSLQTQDEGFIQKLEDITRAP
jgi:pyruvate formate lyase activating enzyme